MKRLAAMLLALALLATACTTGSGSAADDPIVIGAIYPAVGSPGSRGHRRASGA